jgi:hypothetical protein
MGDAFAARPDYACLFATASEQHGYFTASQVRTCGFKRDLLAYHTRHGRFIRIRRGLYRLRDYPSSPREEVVAVWLAVGKDAAVVSHASALDLLDLSDVVPDLVHLTVPDPSATFQPCQAWPSTPRRGRCFRPTSPSATGCDSRQPRGQSSTPPRRAQLQSRSRWRSIRPSNEG